MTDWQSLNQGDFRCEKAPAVGRNGVVVANHPLGAAAGAEMLAAGGSAVDAAVATLFALTVVEPMMVGLIGGGMTHIRDAAGRHHVIDGQSQAPAAARADMFEPVSDEIATRLETVGRRNAVGPLAVATAGNLRAWTHALAKHGTMSLADVMAPAIRHAERGFPATPYLAECAAECAPDLAKDKRISALYLPDGRPIRPSARVVQPAYAETLKAIAKDGPEALQGGAVGRAVAEAMEAAGGILSLADLRDYAIVERDPIRGQFHGVEIVGPPPPSSGGVHVVQMLNVLERFDLKGMGFGSADAIHLLAETLKIAFADRDASTGDPAFLNVPVDRLTDKTYAAERAAGIDMARARRWAPGVAPAGESAHTTHMTVVDRDGAVVAATHTINSLFGARFIVGETGMIANNYMHLFDPHPGRALSIAPGKRVPTSMAPLMALRDGELDFALGLTGGVRIFPSAMQAVVNLVVHGMDLQHAVEAPRIWTQGGVLELEVGVVEAVAEALRARGHDTVSTPHLGGGMNGVRRLPDGRWEGAACWRADGTAIALGGGLARAGVRFWPDQPART